MSKSDKSKKSDGSGNAKLFTTMAMTGGVFVLRKILATAWTRITGRVPPTDLSDPRVTLPEALAWSIVTGLIVETARFAFVRATTNRSLPESETKSS